MNARSSRVELSFTNSRSRDVRKLDFADHALGMEPPFGATAF